MPEYDLMEQAILVVMWVGLIYGLFGLRLAYLALTDLEWRQLIADRMRVRWWQLKLRLCLAWLTIRDLTLRGCQWLQGE